MIEQVIDETVRLLRLHLNSELKRQDGEFNDSIQLQPVLDASILVGMRDLMQTLPAIVIEPESQEVEVYATNTKDVLHTISIGVVLSDTVEEVGYRKIWRMMRAIENVLEINIKSGSGPIIDYQTTDITYDVGPLSISNADSLTKAGILSGEFRERLDAYVATQI